MTKPYAARTRESIMQCYKTYGLKTAATQTMKILKQSETEKIDFRLKTEIKGELSEVILECILLEIQRYIPSSIISKGLCIRDPVTKRTTEMDVTFFTPCKIYMFECKSYSGKKTLTAECTLTNKTTTTDVFSQSKHHMEVLNRYLVPYRLNRDLPGTSPYKLILFELSSVECEDVREDVWKNRIPLLNIDTIYPYLIQDMSTPQKVNWNLNQLVPILQQLDSQSRMLFKEHLNRLGGKK